MDRDRQEEVETLGAQVGFLASHVGRLLHVIVARSAIGMDTSTAEANLVKLERAMWKLHAHQVRLKAGPGLKSEKRLLH